MHIRISGGDTAGVVRMDSVVFDSLGPPKYTPAEWVWPGMLRKTFSRLWVKYEAISPEGELWLMSNCPEGRELHDI